jgi:alkyl hydroperoxide reductase subunit F
MFMFGNELMAIFKPLNAKITLNVATSSHPKNQELLEFLAAIAETSPMIAVKQSSESSSVPKFEILTDSKPTNVWFEGIPSGHEFTSLIVAILNSAGLGKLPDRLLMEKIKNIKSTNIKTYVSLSCENCPDVVQSLNQIALINGSISHTMADGELLPEEVQRLGIQSVPAVFIGDKLIHSGRANLTDLITKLESEAGLSQNDLNYHDQQLGTFDVIIAGGGPAGISAAIYAARKGMKTAIIADKIGGQVTETKGIENLISTTYTEGSLLANNLMKHLEQYPITILEHRRIKNISENSGHKQITLESRETMNAGSVIIATGAQWRRLGVQGEAEYIGRGVAFCPHCDGPFYKSKPVAVIGGGNSGVEAAIDLAGICTHVTLLEFMDALKADEVLVNKLKSLPNITILTGVKTKEIIGNGSKVTALQYETRASGEIQQLTLDGVFVQIGLSPNSGFVKDLVKTTPQGEIIVDEKGRTSTSGIYAAGDVTTTPFKQIVIAIGEGAKTALTVFEDNMYRVGLSHG